MSPGVLRGCAVLPGTLNEDVLRAMRATDDALETEMAALRAKMASFGAEQEDVLHMERTIKTLRQVERSNLATVPGLDATGRALLEAMEATAWDRVIGYARSRRRMFVGNPKKRHQAIVSVKGILAEELFYSSLAFREVMARARQRAVRLGYPPENVRFVRGTRGITLSEKKAGYVNHGELTDGLIVVTRETTLTEAQLAERVAARRSREFERGVSRRGAASPPAEDLHILTVIEAKSPSNVDEIAANHGGNWLGQMGTDTERFKELPSLILDRWYTPEQIGISHYRTEWVAVVPKGRPIDAALLARLGLEGNFRRNFNMYEQEIADEVLNSVTERILVELSSP